MIRPHHHRTSRSLAFNTHVHAAWLDAGWKVTTVDLDREIVIFTKVAGSAQPSPVQTSRISSIQRQKHDGYGKSVLNAVAGMRFSSYGARIAYETSSARIDGTADSMIAVEIESRTSKQVRGSILDLLMHSFPKKLLILIPKWIGPHTLSESIHILSRSLDPKDFQVVLLSGTGDHPKPEEDAEILRTALTRLGCTP